MKKILVFIILMSFVRVTYAQQDVPFYVDSLQMKWVNTVYDSMTLDEKVGQLFIVSAYSNKGITHENEILKLIKDENIGGLIFMQDNAIHQAELTNQYQEASKVPLLIGIDGEWGLAMRLNNVDRFPWAMTVGAVANNNLVEQLGKNIGEQSARIGVNFNFAPVVDVNTNPKNPIIGNRSFGSDVNNVAQKGIAYMRGMRDFKVLASAKHFPGHGDTDKDSHKTLPSINHSLERLNKVELAPFKQLIDAGVASIMVAHLSVPSLEPNSQIPSSLSKKVITDLLKNKLGFKGLIITDALNMSGVTNGYSAGDIDLKAFEAGNDILLFSQAVQQGKQKIITAIEKGQIAEDRLEESVKKILMAKYFVGLQDFKPIVTENLMEDLNQPKYKATTLSLFEEAVTLIKNDENLLPIQNINNIKTAFVPLEESDYDDFYAYLKNYTNVELVKINSPQNISKLKDYDYVIIGVHKSNETAYKSYKIGANSKNIIQAIATQNKTILSVFASPYALIDVDLQNIKAVLVTYQNTHEAHMCVPQIIFGSLPAKGVLPANVTPSLEFGKTIKTQANNRLGFSYPENVGMNSLVLKEIDNIAENATYDGTTPGMQIVAAKSGKIIYQRSFGYQSVAQKKKVENDDLYDVASVTKITATLPLIMQEVSKGELSLDQTLGSILPRANASNKSNITLREVLAHQAGLTPWIGFYKESVNVKNARLYLDYYSRTQDEEHTYKVTDNIYAIKSIKDTILEDIYQSPLGSKKYEYSDIGYYLLQDYLETKYKKSLADLTNENLYQPLGMNHSTYNPLHKFSLDKIIPTEQDKIYRNQLIHGYVHDQGAAMLGGVAGHAGLFSTATDLAKLMQLYLNGGTYGGEQYIKTDVVNDFTRDQYSGNRRGAGFDKMSSSSKNGPSSNSFGHYGFTGTMVWADPDTQIVYVFLSNRVNPSVDNTKLAKHKIREKIRQILYDAIL